MDNEKARKTKAEGKEGDAGRQTRALAGVAIILFLAVVSLYLVQSLKKESQIEDCLMAHRLNCDALIGNQ